MSNSGKRCSAMDQNRAGKAYLVTGLICGQHLRSQETHGKPANHMQAEDIEVPGLANGAAKMLKQHLKPSNGGGRSPYPVRATPGGERPLPSFFVVGPPRTGTSWLHDVLSQNTVLPHPTKETRFFDNHFDRGFDWYQAHFPASTENGLVGEVAPTYFASNLARERIAGAVPGAKVICIFRNPVDRVVSLYRLKRAYGMIPWNFEEAIVRDSELMESSKYGHQFEGLAADLGSGPGSGDGL